MTSNTPMRSTVRRMSNVCLKSGDMKGLIRLWFAVFMGTPVAFGVSVSVSLCDKWCNIPFRF